MNERDIRRLKTHWIKIMFTQLSVIVYNFVNFEISAK